MTTPTATNTNNALPIAQRKKVRVSGARYQSAGMYGAVLLVPIVFAFVPNMTVRILAAISLAALVYLCVRAFKLGVQMDEEQMIITNMFRTRTVQFSEVADARRFMLYWFSIDTHAGQRIPVDAGLSSSPRAARQREILKQAILGGAQLAREKSAATAGD